MYRSTSARRYNSPKSSTRQPRPPLLSHGHEESRSKLKEDEIVDVKCLEPNRKVGYYLCLEFPPFIAPTGLPPSTHYELVTYKLENKWVWSPYHPAEFVSTFKPRNIRQVIIPLRTEHATATATASGIALSKDGRESTKALEYVDGNPVPNSPLSVVIYPPSYVFSEIPTNRNLLFDANIYQALILYMVKGHQPKTPHSVLPFDKTQVLAGITEEAKEMGICRELEVKSSKEFRKAPMYRELTPDDLLASCFILTSPTVYRVLTNLSKDAYPNAITLTLPSTWIWSPGNPDAVPAIYTPTLQVVHIHPTQPDSSFPVKQIVVQPPILSFGNKAQNYPYHTPYYTRAKFEGTFNARRDVPKFFVGRLPASVSEHIRGMNLAPEHDGWFTGITHEGVNHLDMRLKVKSVYFLIRLPSFEFPINSGPQYPAKLTVRSQLHWIYARTDDNSFLPILYTPSPIASLVSPQTTNVKAKHIWVTFPTYVVSCSTKWREKAFLNYPKLDFIGKVFGPAPKTLASTAFFDPIQFAKPSVTRVIVSNLHNDERLPQKLNGMAHCALQPTTGAFGYKATEKYFYQDDFEYLAPLNPSAFGVKNPFLPPGPWVDFDPLKLLKRQGLSEELVMSQIPSNSTENIGHVAAPSQAIGDSLVRIGHGSPRSEK